MERAGAMIYQLLTTDRFDKAFKKLDKQTQRIIKTQQMIHKKVEDLKMIQYTEN